MSRPSPQPSQSAQPVTAQATALLDQVIEATKAARVAEYTPFMAKEPIKLTVDIVLRYLCTPTKSGKVCDERQAVKFIMLCKARLLNPFEGDAYIVGYDSKDGPSFSLITAHQAFLKRAEVHPEYDGMESGVIVQSGDKIIDREGDITYSGDVLLGGWASVFFKSRTHPMRKRLKLATFNSGRSRWNADAAGMIVKCAEADALRSAFPTSLGGMYLEDEISTPTEATVPVQAPALPLGRTNLRKTALRTESVPVSVGAESNGDITHDDSESSGVQFQDDPPSPDSPEDDIPEIDRDADDFRERYRQAENHETIRGIEKDIIARAKEKKYGQRWITSFVPDQAAAVQRIEDVR